MIQDTIPIDIKAPSAAVRLKTELQSRGVRVPASLVDELEKGYNAPALRSGRMVLCLDSPAKDGGLIPVFIVNGRRGAYSPNSYWGVEASVKYWHFVDLVWVFFYPALYLIT